MFKMRENNITVFLTEAEVKPYNSGFFLIWGPFVEAFNDSEPEEFSIQNKGMRDPNLPN